MDRKESGRDRLSDPEVDRPNATLLLPCLLTGGTEIATLETARAFQALGFHPRVIVYFDEVDAAMLKTFEDAGVEVELLAIARRSGRHASFALAATLVRALSKKRSDVIWLQYMTPTLIPVTLARLFSRRLFAAVHVHGNHYRAAGRRRIRWLARFWCSRFVCVSRESARSLFGTPVPSEVAVLPNTFDPSEAASATARHWRQELGWPATSVIIGFVGRLAHNKGADLLLEAVGQLRSRKVDVRAVIVGDGAERTALESAVHSMGLTDCSFFVGRLARDEVFSALKGFDIVAVPSREEGFGLSALEAMVAGVPVVACAVDALGDLIQQGETGLLCRPEDAADLASALERLVTDAGLRATLGARARAHAFEHFGQQAFRARMASLLASNTGREAA